MLSLGWHPRHRRWKRGCGGAILSSVSTLLLHGVQQAAAVCLTGNNMTESQHIFASMHQSGSQ